MMFLVLIFGVLLFLFFIILYFKNLLACTNKTEDDIDENEDIEVLDI